MLIGVDGNEANVENRVGVNQFAYGLLWGLWRQKTKHQFTVFLSSAPLSSLPKEKQNWHYRVIGPPKFWTQWRLPLDLFTHNPKPEVFFTPSHYAPRFSPIPTVISIMDLGFLKSPNEFTKKDYFQLKEWTKYSVNNASHVLTISEFSKKEIHKEYNVPSGKITVVYPGYDKTRFFPQKQIDINRVLEKYNLKQPYILFLSSLKPNKNVERLIEAFSLATQNPLLAKSTLVISGKKGWLYDKIFAKVDELKMSKRVLFTGFLPEQDVPYLLCGASLFAIPSLFEGFGIPAVEAISCETLVVASKIPSLEEAIGPSGIYVDPNNVKDIARGLKYGFELPRPKREKMVKDGVQFVRKFDWDAAASKVVKILEHVIF